MFEWILDPYNYFFWILLLSIIAIVMGILYRPFSTYIRFIYPNAKFEAMGNPFVEEKQLNNILESKTLLEFKDTLNMLRDYQVEGEDVYSLQRSLDKNLIQTIRMMRGDSTKKLKDFYDAYEEKIDLYLIKNQIKRIVMGDKKTETERADEAISPRTKMLLEKLVDAEKKDLPELLRSHGFEEELIHAVTQEPADIQKIDVLIDKHVIKKLRNARVPYKCDRAKQSFINSMIDIINIKNILRAKHLRFDAESSKKLFLGEGQEIAAWKFMEMAEMDHVSQVISALEGTSYFDVLKNAIEQYNTEQSVQVLEIALDNHFLKTIRDISMQNYLNLGPTIRFLISKEFEIKNLKIIIKGISENIPTGVVKNLLVKER